jgi:hypothetical protein
MSERHSEANDFFPCVSRELFDVRTMSLGSGAHESSLRGQSLIAQNVGIFALQALSPEGLSGGVNSTVVMYVRYKRFELALCQVNA